MAGTIGSSRTLTSAELTVRYNIILSVMVQLLNILSQMIGTTVTR
jgi:hypothetical protein